MGLTCPQENAEAVPRWPRDHRELETIERETFATGWTGTRGLPSLLPYRFSRWPRTYSSSTETPKPGASVIDVNGPSILSGGLPIRNS
jgi:hypothetical protein